MSNGDGKFSPFPKMHLYFYSRCSGNDVGKIYVEIQGVRSGDPPCPFLATVLGSQPAGDVSHKPGGRLPLLSTRPAFTLATLKRAATNFAAR